MNLNVTNDEWREAEAYFKKNPTRTKYERKNEQRKNIRDYSFIKVGDEIYAKQTSATDILGEGASGKVKLIQNKAGESFAVKIEGSGLKGNETEEVKIMNLLGELRGEAEREYGKVFKGQHANKKLYTVMKLHEGTELHKVFLRVLYDPNVSQKEKLIAASEEQKLILAIRSAECVKHLHDKSIIHADIKTDNFLVDLNSDKFKAALIDFGHSMILPKGQTSIKKSIDEPVRGTPRFQAPEIFPPNSTYSFASDIYALGKIYQLEDQIQLFNLEDDFYKKMTRENPKERPRISEVINFLYTKLAQQPNLSQQSKDMLSLKAQEQLLSAAWNGKPKDIQAVYDLLADKRIDPNLATKDGGSPLIYAAQNDHIEIVKTLLADKRIKINQADKNGCTALGYAAQKGHLEIVKVLLANGAKPNQADKKGVTPIQMAKKNQAVVDTLRSALEQPSAVVLLEQENREQKNQTKHHHQSKSLLKKQEELLSAAWHDNHKAVKTLLTTEGIDPNHANEDGGTALGYAVQRGHLEIINTLLADKRIKINQSDKYGGTALSYAVLEGRLDIVNALLNKGAKPNQGNKAGNTPLGFAAEKGSIKIVEALLDKRANPNQADNIGITPIQIAEENNHKEIAEILRSHISQQSLQAAPPSSSTRGRAVQLAREQGQQRRNPPPSEQLKGAKHPPEIRGRPRGRGH